MFSRTVKCTIAKDNGRASEFIRKKVYKDKSRCYECGVSDQFFCSHTTNHTGRPLWGLDSSTIILLFSGDFEVFFGNGCFLKWINFKVGAIYSHSIPRRYFFYSQCMCVCCCQKSVMLSKRCPICLLHRATKTHAIPLKSYTAYEHMEALPSVYVIFQFFRCLHTVY